MPHLSYWSKEHISIILQKALWPQKFPLIYYLTFTFYFLFCFLIADYNKGYLFRSFYVISIKKLGRDCWPCLIISIISWVFRRLSAVRAPVSPFLSEWFSTHLSPPYKQLDAGLTYSSKLLSVCCYLAVFWTQYLKFSQLENLPSVILSLFSIL